MDIVTKNVQQQYMAYPFPNSGENINLYKNADWFINMLSFFEEVAPKNKKSFLEGVDILEAGCGTGPTISKIAQLYPTCYATGIDLSTESLDIATAAKNKHDLKNLHFKQENILEMDLNKKFDVIICIGVLHHLSDMNTGLKNLKKHLNDGGYILLWLYGKHGRYYLNLHQELFKTLFSRTPSLEKKVSLTKTFLTQINSNHIASHIDTPNQDPNNLFNENLKQTLENDSWLVDQYLHVNEQTLSMPEILNMLERHNMNLIRWLGVDISLQSYIDNPEIISLFENLTLNERLACLDLLLKPNYYMLAIN